MEGPMTHKYQLPIFEPGWSVLQELQLFEALKIFGAENWEQAANFMGVDFTARQVCEHYQKWYGDHRSEQTMIPTEKQLAIAHETSNAYTFVKVNLNSYIKDLQYEKAKRKREMQQCDAAPEQIPEPKYLLNRIPSVFGFNPYTQEFGYSYNEEAEVLLIKLQFQHTDTQSQRQRKIQVLRHYNQLIKERLVIEKGALEHKLLEPRYQLVRVNSSDYNRKREMQARAHSELVRQGRARKSRGSYETMIRQLDLQASQLQSQGLSKQLRVPYTKLKKFDERKCLENKLLQFEQLCSKLAELKANMLRDAHNPPQQQQQ